MWCACVCEYQLLNDSLLALLLLTLRVALELNIGCVGSCDLLMQIKSKNLRLEMASDLQ